ncbi:2oxoglutarate dehydrogenase [Seminavis robusta]|uniref:2oxoglutarate dehydrogenase n=1 Tax=Seminavis robusta TaxID=568900 RepID=A0A9N8HLI5_9STRA|nr:2oxoglutarate dehydrogenase [Seminavis robusta]|eukprot:Sro919_g220160.1 2oxoglutarate dehydrogenase (489) ;mRNA; f:37274-38740
MMGKLQEPTNPTAKPMVPVAPLEIDIAKPSSSDERTFAEITKPHHNWKLKYIVMDWSFSFLIGFLVVSFWRGGWTLMDLWDCSQSPSKTALVDGLTFCGAADIRAQVRIDSAIRSYWIGLLWLFVSVLFIWSGAWEYSFAVGNQKTASDQGRYPLVADLRYGAAVMLRCITVFGFGTAAIHLWRGIWYGLDYWVLYEEPFLSWWTTTLIGIAGAHAMGAGASLLAPPSVYLLDGPSNGASPAIGVTILTSIYNQVLPANSQDAPSLPKALYGIDILGSFLVLPIFVLGFWRGCWGLMDNYLWGFVADNNALYLSILYSFLIAIGCLVVASDDVLFFLPKSFQSSPSLQRIISRVKNLILALGTVNFWRFVWYIWDAFLGGPTHESAWASHILGIVGLATLGCLASIAAPPSTIGVDVLAPPEAAEDTLFRTLPLPAQESLFLFGIARQLEPTITVKMPEDTENSSDSSSSPGEEEDSSSNGSMGEFSV